MVHCIKGSVATSELVKYTHTLAKFISSEVERTKGEPVGSMRKPKDTPPLAKFISSEVEKGSFKKLPTLYHPFRTQ